MHEESEFVETGLDDPSLAALTRGFARRLRRLHRREQADSRVLGLLDWGRTWLPEHFRVEPSVMHHWMAEQLQAAEHNRAARINVIGPRGHAKSTVATLAYLLRVDLEGAEPYIWIVSETAEQAALHLANIKTELLGNARLREEYPEAAARGPIWRGELIVLGNGVAIEALGSGQQVRGRRWRQHRPSLIVCDDLEGDRHVVSQRARGATQRWFHTALMKAGGPRTNVIHLGTALHREALGMQLCRTPGWTARVFPALGRMPERMELWQQWERLLTDWECAEREATAEAYWQKHRAEMETGCQLLWPGVDDLPRLMRLRAEGGLAAFEREKQCSPSSPEACEWPLSYFAEPLWFDDWPENLRAKVLALDPGQSHVQGFENPA